MFIQSIWTNIHPENKLQHLIPQKIDVLLFNIPRVYMKTLFLSFTVHDAAPPPRAGGRSVDTKLFPGGTVPVMGPLAA